MKTSSLKEVNGVVNTPFSTKSFNVDSDFDWMKLSLSFTKKGWYSLFIWDPAQNLRAQALYINETKNITLSTNPEITNFSSVPGPILKGEWKLEILAATYKANPDYTLTYECGQATVESEIKSFDSWIEGTDHNNGFKLNLYDSSKVLKQEQKWYKGDFHTHTTESDGKMTPERGMEQAKKMGLDYFTATDHNILPTKWLKDDLLVIPGIEITSTKGHFNALGLTTWVDWRPTCADGGMETDEGMTRILGEARKAGAIVSLNHPMLKPWEWQYKNTPLSAFDVIEIWNDPTYKDNPKATEEALSLWSILWNDGHRIYGIGGSDSHLLPEDSYEKNGPPSVIGDPATYVFAEELSADSILLGVRKGNVYVSRGPVLDCDVKVNDIGYKPGKDLKHTSDDKEIHFTYELTYENIPEDSSLYWILNGTNHLTCKLQQSGKISESFKWNKDETNWLRFEIRKQNGELLVFANPVYLGEKQPTIHTWGELLRVADYTN